MKSTLYLPKKIIVGFQERSDTYTGKLAYVIYYDSKGVLRKETSWESWRNKSIEPQEFDNVPTEGFVLNKKVGDYVCNWNHRQAYTRVYDPRGFEFEITIENLLYILENTSSIKGKGLEGEFVYTWNGTDLVLMPTCTPDFKSITEYNEVLQSNKKFNTKNMVIGGTYRTKDDGELVYIGKYPVYDTVYVFDGKTFPSYRKMQVYADKVDKPLLEKVYREWGFSFSYRPVYEEKIGVIGKHFWFASKDKSGKWRVSHQSNSSNIIDVIEESCHPEYAEIFDVMERNPDYSPYDKSRDEIIYYTWEEFLDELSGENHRYFNIEINGRDIYDHFNIKDDEPDKIYLYLWGANDATKNIFLDKETKESKGIPLKEFFETYRPHCWNLYLMNGKIWRERTKLSTYEKQCLEQRGVC